MDWSPKSFDAAKQKALAEECPKCDGATLRKALDLSDRTRKHLLTAQQQLAELAASDHTAFRKMRNAIRQQYSRTCNPSD